MRLTKCAFGIAAAFLFIAVPVQAAIAYHFKTTTEGFDANHREGRVVVDGSRWRIDFDAIPNDVIELNAIVATADGSLIAINDSNRTWFRLKSRERLGINNALFTFLFVGETTLASEIHVSFDPAKRNPRPDRDAVPRDAAPPDRISFSYRIDTKVSSYDVKGKVWGEIRVWTTQELEQPEIPWRAFDLQTGFDAVDAALRVPLSGVRGIPWQSEVEVSRRLEDGEVLRQVVRRTIGPLEPIVTHPGQFTVPSGYRYQEPAFGVP